MKVNLFLRAQREDSTPVTEASAPKGIESERSKIDVEMKKEWESKKGKGVELS